MRGPRPTPTALRMIQGSVRGDRANAAEPLPPVTDLPRPPVWLHAYAVECWNDLAPDLYSMGVLTDVDARMFTALCMAWARWQIAEEDLAKMAENDPVTHALLLKTKEGNAVQNPLVGVANVARRDFARMASEFGLSPAARVQITAKGKADADPAARKYFGP